MKSNLAFLLLLIVVLSLLMLVWTGERIRDREEFIQYHFTNVLKEQVENYSGRIYEETERLMSAHETSGVRRIGEDYKYIRSFIVINNDGEITAGAQSGADALVNNIRGIFASIQGDTDGWVLGGTADNDPYLLHWEKRNTGYFIVWVDQDALFDEVVKGLPQYTTDFKNDRLVIYDPQGAPAYIWGNVSPETHRRAQVTIALQGPLQGYELQYFVPPTINLQRNMRFQFFIGFVMIS